MKKQIIVVALLIVLMTTILLAECLISNKRLNSETNYDLVSEKTYDMVIYDGEPFLEIITEHKYLHTLEDGTLIITDKQINEEMLLESICE